jgi:hypothetical protein
VFEGTRYLMYTQREVDCGGSITTPKLLKTLPDKRLVACYSPLIEKLVKSKFIDEPNVPKLQQPMLGYNPWNVVPAKWTENTDCIIGESRTGWHTAIFDTGNIDNCIYCATVKLDPGTVAAGISFRVDDKNIDKLGIFAIDSRDQCVFFSNNRSFENLLKRKVKIEHDREYLLRVITKNEQVELYLDDVLMLQFGTLISEKETNPPLNGKLGLFVDRGRARFTKISASQLSG